MELTAPGPRPESEPNPGLARDLRTRRTVAVTYRQQPEVGSRRVTSSLPGVVAVTVLLSTGCGRPRSPPPDPAASQIQVAMASSQGDALKQTRRAFQDEGFQVDPPLRRDSTLSTESRQIADGIWVSYQAVVHATDAGAVVTLRGWVLNLVAAARDAALLGMPGRPEHPLTRNAKDEEQVGWSRLQLIADRLRSNPPPP